ncbi:NAD(P)-binding protein [Bimuria novae-zelandiae CBS 107.79]|uniref:NAD(P)-binding protein n=1 Tax=Bimuria novae-zelandiae CBS 107.79 TaxID=1447943 RepID=A0A6A5VD07_9PLEO|nr:NAD(P)-binding protein [Bimuria novae-zelandiae CBS 107.79]
MDVQAPLNSTDLFSAKGLVVVITGGGSGIGLAYASTLYQNGAAKIYILGRRQNVLEDAIKTVEASPSAPQKASHVLEAIACDVIDRASVASAVEKITKDTGYVDVLINNAGILGPTNGGDLYKATSIEQVRDAMLQGFGEGGWDAAMRINTQAVVGVSAAFLPLLDAANARRGWASGKVEGEGNPRAQDTSALEKIGADKDDDRMAQIITTASVASFMRYVTAGLAYNASKSAAAQLGKILASVLAPWGVRSNVVAPGPYPSEMTKSRDPRFGTGQVPQGRMGGVNDVAGLLLFLVGKGGAYVNGTVQVTDGGRMGVFPGTY